MQNEILKVTTDFTTLAAGHKDVWAADSRFRQIALRYAYNFIDKNKQILIHVLYCTPTSGAKPILDLHNRLIPYTRK